MNDLLKPQQFECGCVWSWKKSLWIVTCWDHYEKNARPIGCACLNTGKDDGATTCWDHHDCSRGDCTHTDN